MKKTFEIEQQEKVREKVMNEFKYTLLMEPIYRLFVCLRLWRW